MSTALKPLTPTYQVLPNTRNGVWGWFHASHESQAMGAVSMEGEKASPSEGACAAAIAAAIAALTINIVVTETS